MLTDLRAAWARQSFADARALLSRAWALSPRAARLDETPRIIDGLQRIEGPLSLNPMSGALFRGTRRLPPPPEAAGGEPCPTDWIVQTFPARSRIPAIAPIWYGARPDLAAILTEALPRAIQLERVAGTEGAVAVVSLALGRLDRMQEALGAGLFAPRALKVQAWDKLIFADLAWRPAEPPSPADLREAGRRLCAAFPAPAAAPVPAAPLVLLTGGAEAARGLPDLTEAAASAGAEILDPDATPLSRLIPTVRAAKRILFGPDDEICLALAAGQGADLARIEGDDSTFRGDQAAAALENPARRVSGAAASAWLDAGTACLTP